MSREEWRTRILPRTFKERWDNPKELYVAIVNALSDGFFSETLEPSERLVTIAPDEEYAANIRVIVLMKNNQYDKAEQYLSNFMKVHGETGGLLTNLAKAQMGKNDNEKARETLWSALQKDPNQDNGLDWFISMARDENGDEGYRRALLETEKLPGSWRPQLYLGRLELTQGNYEEALEYFRFALEKAPNEPDVLYIISGEMGKHGHSKEMVSFIAPLYNPQVHGIRPGINLLQAYVETNNPNEGKKLLPRLRDLQQHDFKEHLDYYEKAFSVQ